MGNLLLIPKLIGRSLTETEQKLSLVENAHKTTEKVVGLEQATDWIKAKPVPKVLPS